MQWPQPQPPERKIDEREDERERERHGPVQWRPSSHAYYMAA